MSNRFVIRPVLRSDFRAWRTRWDGYNAFYGRSGETALPEDITQATWERFFTHQEPVCAIVAAVDGVVVGLAHYLFHRSTSRLANVCYLQDLYSSPEHRGQGIGGLLIQSVYSAAQAAGSSRVYWQTQSSNEAGRRLYDKVGNHRGYIVYSHEL